MNEALIRAGLYYRNDWNAMGYEVMAMLEDGGDVLKLLEEQRADVLLTDICMYQVSGLEVAKMIQEKYPWMQSGMKSSCCTALGKRNMTR